MSTGCFNSCPYEAFPVRMTRMSPVTGRCMIFLSLCISLVGVYMARVRGGRPCTAMSPSLVRGFRVSGGAARPLESDQ